MKRIILVLMLLSLLSVSVFAVSLSDEERAWLKAQKEITIGAMDNWAPLNFLGYDGKASGIGADIIFIIIFCSICAAFCCIVELLHVKLSLVTRLSTALLQMVRPL